MTSEKSLEDLMIRMLRKRSSSQSVAQVLSYFSNRAEMTRRENVDTSKSSIESRLLIEFGKVKTLLEINGLRGVVWWPDESRGLSGEVKDGLVRIYESDEDKALRTLRHEMLDFQITSKIIQPLVEVINLLIKSREVEVYKEKERIVGQLSKLLDSIC